MEIDTTPLADAMPVLLVILTITAPPFHQDLPKVDASKLDDKPTSVQVAVDAKGGLFVDGARVEPTELGARLAELVRFGGSAVEMRSRADRTTRYEHVAEVVASTRRASFAKFAFVDARGRSACHRSIGEPSQSIEVEPPLGSRHSHSMVAGGFEETS
ncbi:MAG: biopolymer transporter ExbD [Rubrivivax sp.]